MTPPEMTTRALTFEEACDMLGLTGQRFQTWLDRGHGDPGHCWDVTVLRISPGKHRYRLELPGWLWARAHQALTFYAEDTAYMPRPPTSQAERDASPDGCWKRAILNDGGQRARAVVDRIPRIRHEDF